MKKNGKEEPQTTEHSHSASVGSRRREWPWKSPSKEETTNAVENQRHHKFKKNVIRFYSTDPLFSSAYSLKTHNNVVTTISNIFFSFLSRFSIAFRREHLDKKKEKES